MAEFAWDKLEKSDGEFDFDWLENIVNTLGKNGIMTILCTPTACPPIWLYEKHDIYYVNPLGYKKPFGARRHYCPTGAEMRFYSERIALEMAKRFGNNPYVYGWQIDNELGHNASARCRCKNCEAAFQNHLRKKFNNDIDELNRAFGTYFWAGTYSDFSQILPPSGTIERNTVPKYNSFFENPSIRLEFERFSSNSMKEFFDLQVDAIRKYSKKPITTNSTGLATNSIDYFELYKKADRYGIDNYPSMFHGNNDYCAVNFAAGRGCKDSPFWVMEFTVGGGHTTPGGGRIQPYPGAIEQNVVYSYAAGASMLLHFQYKTFRSGGEQLNYALIDADRIPRRRYQEFKNTVNSIEKIEQVLGNVHHKKSRSAIVMNYSDLWATEIKPLSAETHYMPLLKKIFSAMNSLNAAPDIISTNSPLEDYDLIIIPYPVTISNEFKTKLKSYVNCGGTLISTMGCAIKDENNLGVDVTLPGNLTDLFGIEIQESEPILNGVNNMTALYNNEIIEMTDWIDVLKCTTAKPIATIRGTHRDGACVISKNSYGKGRAYYLGTFPSDMTDFFKNCIAEAGITVSLIPSYGTDIQIMQNEAGQDYIFVFNYLMDNTLVKLDKQFKNALTGEILTDNITLPAKGYIILTEQ